MLNITVLLVGVHPALCGRIDNRVPCPLFLCRHSLHSCGKGSHKAAGTKMATGRIIYNLMFAAQNS